MGTPELLTLQPGAAVNYVLFMGRNVATRATFITYLLTNWTLLSLKYRSSLALVVFVVSPAFKTSNMEGYAFQTVPGIPDDFYRLYASSVSCEVFTSSCSW
jgi:hypothetical protein